MKITTLFMAMLFAAGSFAQEVYKVNLEESKVNWHAEKVTGTHDGHIKIKSGTVHVTDGKFSGGAFVIDMTTVVVTDMDDDTYNQKLARHLMSPDFFSSAEHPTARFDIEKVIHQGKDRYKVEGKMTIKGITNKNKFTAYINYSNNKIVAKADMIIDRSEYDVRYGSGSFFDDLGDKTIYDEFSLKVELVAEKK